jgi:hypothetical protein
MCPTMVEELDLNIDILIAEQEEEKTKESKGW